MGISQSGLSVLVVDDDEDIRYALSNILKKCDCVVTQSESVESARETLTDKHYDVVFCDMRFHGGEGGEEFLEFANQNSPDTNVVLVSCAMDSQRKQELIAKGASVCLQKPFFRDTCLDVLSELQHLPQKVA